MRRVLSALLLLVAPLGGAAMAQPAESAQAALPFTVELPPGFEVLARAPGPDFDLYDIVSDGKAYVGIYSGGYANFPIREESVVEKRADGVLVGRRNGRAAEYLLSREDGWPRQLHIWVQTGEGVDPAVADRIAASIKFVK